MSGPLPDLIRTVSQATFFRENVAFSVKRGADLNAAAKLLLFEYSAKPVETKKRNLDQFVDEAAAISRDQLELVARRVVDTLEDMSSLFLPRDPLLASEGMIPVYYWFVRSLSPKHIGLIRPFLVDFENQRKENRQSGDEGGNPLDPELAEFDRLNRNTNDTKSHEVRIEILSARFNGWQQAQKPSQASPSRKRR